MNSLTNYLRRRNHSCLFFINAQIKFSDLSPLAGADDQLKGKIKGGGQS
jgi:hypothetical protein